MLQCSIYIFRAILGGKEIDQGVPFLIRRDMVSCRARRQCSPTIKFRRIIEYISTTYRYCTFPQTAFQSHLGSISIGSVDVLIAIRNALHISGDKAFA